MTRAKFLANEQREQLFAAAGYICECCGGPIRKGVPQLAHRIASSKTNLRAYGKRIIHHPLNLAVVCSLMCNSSMLIGNDIIAEAALVKRIEGTLREG